MKSRQPTKLSILGVPFVVQWDKKPPDATGELNFGETCGEERAIYISTKRCVTEPIIESTLLHEAIHAVLYAGGHDKDEKEEEHLVTCLEHGLYPVICELVSRGYFGAAPNKKKKRK